MKGLLTFYQIEFPQTHDLKTLIELLRPSWSDLPDSIEKADELTNFAVMTRYPHEFEHLSLTEAKNAVKASESACNEILIHLKNKGLTIP